MSTCVDCQTHFTVRDEDRAFYQKMDVPEPRQCPDCRLMRRLTERNPRTLYTRTCDATGQSIISQYHATVPFPVYQAEHWWRGEWDALQYGRDVDFSRSFFEQMKELKAVVPHPALTVIPATLENSDFNNCVGYLKNCYLIAESDYDEDCYYSNLLKQCKDVADSSFCYQVELGYECLDSADSYNLRYSQDCSNCRDSAFLYNCESCRDCIGCTNQRGKQYMIFNQQLSREEYERQKAALRLDAREDIESVRAQAHSLWAATPRRSTNTINVEHSSGNQLYNAKNAYHCFDCKDIEDSAYCAKLSIGVKSCYDYSSWGDRAELVYCSSVCGDGVYNLRFCTTSFTNLRDCTYADTCVSSSNLFGCVGVRGKQYCVLNKQYTKEEYEALVPRIIEHMTRTGEWGEFFPKDYTSYGYNETLAQEVFPLTRQEALARGYGWQDELPVVTGHETIASDELPSTAADIDAEALSGKVVTCADCQRNYKLIVHELLLYKQLQVPVPLRCPNCRHRDRMALRLPLKLWERKCGCDRAGHQTHTDGQICPNHFETAYPPERPEVVYCEPCFQAEFVA